MQASEKAGAGYPKTIELLGEEIRLRLMEPSDGARLHDFFMALPQQDLLFLQRDVTDAGEIDAWVREIETGEAVTLLAESEAISQILGVATVHRNHVPWTRHVGSVQVVTDSHQRGRGLGRLLLEEIFQAAAANGVEKIVAEMTVEQMPAKRLFESLGFREEGHYRNYAKDLRGVPHDLIVMTHDQPALSDRPAGAIVAAPWRCSACGHVTSSSEPLSRCPDCGASGEHLSQVRDSAPDEA